MNSIFNKLFIMNYYNKIIFIIFRILLNLKNKPY